MLFCLELTFLKKYDIICEPIEDGYFIGFSLVWGVFDEST